MLISNTTQAAIQALYAQIKADAAAESATLSAVNISLSVPQNGNPGTIYVNVQLSADASGVTRSEITQAPIPVE